MAFDGLPISKSPEFGQLVQQGRLRFSGTADETADSVDDYTSRLICACISSRRNVLIVWPDRAERRACLALATAVVCDSVLKIGAAQTRGRILYVGEDSAIREQFAAVRVGRTALSGVFVQEFGRGDGQLRREGPHSTLPVITTILSPVDPATAIRSLRPRWIAVDCCGGDAPGWLSPLMESAKAQGVPVVGWTDHHISSVVQQWRGLGGAVLCWPRAAAAGNRFGSMELLAKAAIETTVVSLVLAGTTAKTLSNEFASCYQRLTRHVGRINGRLHRDAMAVAWRYLRLLESVPVPIEIYEVERVHSWGMPALAGLRKSLERFAEALSGDTTVGQDVEQALHGLTTIHDALQNQSDPPMWYAAADLAISSQSPVRLIFPNRAFREMFRFALLGRRNVTEAELSARGVFLEALSDRRLPDTAMPGPRRSVDMTLVGLPSRLAEWRLDPLLGTSQLQVLLWPHLESFLGRRVSEWSCQLEGGCEGPLPFQLSAAARSSSRVRVAGTREVRSGDATSALVSSGTEPQPVLWKKPDAAEAIRALFETHAEEEDATTNAGDLMTSPDDSYEVVTAQEDEWVEQALAVVMDDGSQLLLPLDEQVNVVVRSQNGVAIAPRFCRSLRVGDEVLLVHGQHRRSLYDLLLSRVHRHRLVDPWLMMIERWHDDIRRAFQESKQRSGMTLESLLIALRARGSSITTAPAVRGWVTGITMAPSNPEDIRRLGDLFGLSFPKQYSKEIRNAASRLKALHINLSARLNRWLTSEDAGSAALSAEQSIIDAELGLTIEDFRHSLVRRRVARVSTATGPFLRSHLGHLRRSIS